MAGDPTLFDSAWWKWSRGTAHSFQLYRDITKGASSRTGQPFLSTAHYYEPKHHCFVVTVEKIEDTPTDWGLTIGDVVTNWRSCLDHIAWAVVTRGRTPPSTLSPRAQSRIYFPLANQRDQFNNAIAARLPGAKRADIAIIRRYQPYQRRLKRMFRFSLGNLGQFANDDKHRSIRPMWVLPRHADFQITPMKDCTFTRTGPPKHDSGRLEVGTELCRVYVRRTGPNPDIHVGGQISGDVIIDDRAYIGDWLAVTRAVIAKVLLEFQEAPLAFREDLGVLTALGIEQFIPGT